MKKMMNAHALRGHDDKRMSKRYIQLPLIMMTLLMCVAAGVLAQTGEEVREEFHQTYPLSATGRLSLENINGAVHINAWDRNEVRLDAVKKAYTRERLDEARIIVDAGPDAIHIRTKYPDENMSFNNDARQRLNNPASVEYTLSLPRAARIEEIELVNGSIEIEGMTGDVVASSVNGHVRARGLVGETKLSTVNGPIEAIFDRLGEIKSVSLNSVNGPLTLTIPSDANALVKANTLSGSISNDYSLPVHDGEYVGHELSGVLGKGGTRIRLNNVNGSIQIRHAADNRPLSPASNLLSEKIKNKDKEMADRETAREARRAAVAAQRDAVHVQVDAQRIAREANAEAQREMQRDSQRLARETSREARRELEQAQADVQRALKANVYGNNSLRFVERESKSFTVSGTPRVTLETFDGPVIVRAWDKPEVMYTAIKRAGTEQELRGINLQAQQNGSEIRIVAQFDKAAARQIEPGITNISAQVNLEVFVPRSTALNASSGDGRLYLEGVRGEINLRSGDGAIDVRESGGRLTATTGDGRIRVAGFDGAAEVRTGDGGITLEGRFAQLSARTGDGGISLSLPADANVTIETDAEDVINDGLAVREDTEGSSRRVRRWTVGSGGTLYKLHTGDGHISLRRAN